MTQQPFTVHQTVSHDYIDHNHHMHDAYYNVIFSQIINDFNYSHGLSLEERDDYQYTLFTAEEHTAYLAQLTEDEPFDVQVWIYNFDMKRIHFVLLLYKEDGTLAATNETMMIGINRQIERTAPFQKVIYNSSALTINLNRRFSGRNKLVIDSTFRNEVT